MTVTRPRSHQLVIPAKAGIHFDPGDKGKWIPAFAGMTECERIAQKRASSHRISA
jgi:hypothetical protein